MMQVVENWANVEGIVEETTRDPAMPDHAHIRMHLIAAKSIGDSPNLFRRQVGQDINLLVRDESRSVSLAPGSHIAVRARVATPSRAFGALDDLVVLK